MNPDFLYCDLFFPNKSFVYQTISCTFPFQQYKAIKIAFFSGLNFKSSLTTLSTPFVFYLSDGQKFLAVCNKYMFFLTLNFSAGLLYEKMQEPTCLCA